jgi:hypothetical protein
MGETRSSPFDDGRNAPQWRCHSPALCSLWVGLADTQTEAKGLSLIASSDY